MSDSEQQAIYSALQWVARRHSGRWSTREEAKLQEWLTSDPTHASAWLLAQREWERLEGLRPLAAAELKTARRHRTLPNLRWPAGVAAVLLCAVGILFAAQRLPGAFERKSVYLSVRGEHRTVQLADGSTIELNTATQVSVDYGLTCRCLRLLAGEAIFHGAHGDPRRFELSAGPTRVRDIGTEFWVRAGSDSTEVAVLDGSVEVTPLPDASPAFLRAGERLAFAPDGSARPSERAPLTDLTAWRQGMIVFRDAPLAEAFAEFARYHPVNVQMDASLDRYRLSGRFATHDIDGLLRLVESAYPVEVRRNGDAIRLLRKPL